MRAVALAGVGLGGLAYALTAANRPATLVAFATTCLLEGAAVAATYALGDSVALLALSMGSLRAAGFVAQIAGWTLVTAIVVVPPAVVAGYQFPLLIAMYAVIRPPEYQPVTASGQDATSEQVVVAYEIDAAGQIDGVDDDLDRIPLADSGGWAACQRLGANVADTGAGTDTAETGVGDQGDFFAKG